MAIFGKKPKIPGIDVNALTSIAQGTAAKKRSIVEGLGGQLQPLSAGFEAKRGKLGEGFTTDTQAATDAYRGELAGLKQSANIAGDESNRLFREQQFRNVPEIQKSIREALGGSGTLNTGAARVALAKPLIGAVQASSDFEAQNEINRLADNARLDEKGADFAVGAKREALSTKFGLDADTINYLTSIGRQDLIDKANSLVGIEGDLGADTLAIEQSRQANEIARASAAANKRNAVLSGLTTLGGAGIGALFGGPLGATLGGQLGSNAGQLATGQPVQFDPTVLFAMANRPSPTRSAVVRGLGGRIPVGTGSY